jgi:type I restriction-modification system DNA methylase subunit
MTITFKIKQIMADMPDTLNTKKAVDDYYKKAMKKALENTEKKQTEKLILKEKQDIYQNKEVKMEKKGQLINILKNGLDILRDNEGLTGDKALRNMSYFLILKLIEPHLAKEIDIDNCDYYDFSHIEDDNVENHKEKLLKIVRFSNLVDEKEDNLSVNMKYLWDDILSKHPSTKNIFLNDKGFDIQRQSTYKNLINLLKTLPETENDILGDAYEEIIQHIMIGKELGQFFTPLLIKKMMVNLIDPQIYPDGKIDSCCDPTMGTGGFLITYMKDIMEQAAKKDIKLDWDFIKNEGLYGKEINLETHQLAFANMFITSGHIFDKLEKGDSIRDPIVRKFDNILANPPFGINGLKYDDYNNLLKEKYTPIKTDNAVSLFTQAIIYMLKINGKCAVVFPYGQELWNKEYKFKAIREYLLKTCDLKEIICLPIGVFEHTNIETCVFYFIKKKEGEEILDTTIKFNKNNKETSREYKFSNTHQTTNVKFYHYNPSNDVKKFLVEVSIENIASNSYSLYYTEYIKDVVEETQYEDGVVIKKIGEFCSIIKGKKRRSKDAKQQGLYPLYYCSILGNLYLNTFDYTGEGIIINKTNGSGKAMVYYGCKKYNVGQTTLHFKSNNETEIKTQYVYYYLYNNIEALQKYYKGAQQKSIDEKHLFKINIPIPSIERQQEIIEYCENKDNINKQLEKEIENNKKQASQFMATIIK